MQNFKILTPVTMIVIKNIYKNMNFLINSHVIDYDYINSKSNQTILFLHGWGGNKDSFAKLKRVLKLRYNILSPSLPPFEQTAIKLTMHDYKDILLALLRSLGIDSVVIICHSFGLRVSLMLATTNLTIEKIIITGGAGIRLKQNFFSKLSSQFRSIFLKSNPQYFNLYASSDYKSLSNINRETFKCIVNKDLTNNIKLFHCPIFLFWGNKDTATPIKMLKIFKKLQPLAECKIIKNATHFCYLEHNELFVNECEKFLNL